MCLGHTFDNHLEAVQRYTDGGLQAHPIQVADGTPVTKMYDKSDNSAVFIEGTQVSNWVFGDKDIKKYTKELQKAHELAASVSKQLV